MHVVARTDMCVRWNQANTSQATPRRTPGDYEELNVFGSPTGWSRHVRKGDPLPELPRGFLWRHVPPPTGVLSRRGQPVRRIVLRE